MKTYAYILSVLVAVMVSPLAFADGADSSAHQGALFNGDTTKAYDAIHSGGPRLISVGVGVQQQQRGMEYENGFKASDLKANHLAATLGLDVTKWLTLFGGVGEADVNLGGNNRSSNFEWLAGGQVRMLDYLVLEPWNSIDQYWVGLDLNSFFRNTSVDSMNVKDTMSEFFTSLTMSFYSTPKDPWAWDRLGLFIGPAVSMIDYGDQSENQAFGIVGGLQLNPSPNIGLRFEVQKFDKMGMGLSATFHF
ncbi:MAG: hypothetical protein WCO42_05895 [bacterium]